MAEVRTPAGPQHEVTALPEYGDACSEVVSIHNAVGVAPIRQSVLALAGEDRISFMHNISSNDVKSLQSGQGCESLILTPKGKIQFPLVILAGPSCLDVLVEEPVCASLKDFLDSSLIMEEVTVTDRSSEYHFFHLAGRMLRECMSEMSLTLPEDKECSWAEQGDVTVIRRRRSIQAGVDLRIPAGASAGWFEKLQGLARRLGGGPVGTIAQDILRIEAAIPKFGADFTAEQFPQEASLEERSVSFTKGCYTGQEVVARIKTYGGVRHRVVGLRIDGPPAAPGDRLFKRGVESGRVTSAARSIHFAVSVALATVDVKLAAAPGTVLNVADPAGAPATVVDIAAPMNFERAWRI